jgi:hypothetical protein
MAPSQENLFDPDASEQEIADEMEALFMAFHEHVQEFAQERELNDGMVSLLTLRLSLSARMFDYVMSTEQPSGSGLKLELERYRRDVDDAVRAARKGADDFVAKAREAIAEAEADDTPE